MPRRAGSDHDRMFEKLTTIILTVALTSAALLVSRQHRLDLAHEAASVARRCHDHQRTLWTLEAEIVRRCRPEEIRLVLESMPEDWVPIPALTPATIVTPPETRLADRTAPPQDDDLGG